MCVCDLEPDASTNILIPITDLHLLKGMLTAAMSAEQPFSAISSKSSTLHSTWLFILLMSNTQHFIYTGDYLGMFDNIFLHSLQKQQYFYINNIWSQKNS